MKIRLALHIATRYDCHIPDKTHFFNFLFAGRNIHFTSSHKFLRRLIALFSGEFTTSSEEKSLKSIELSFFIHASPSMFSSFLISDSLFCRANETPAVNPRRIAMVSDRF
ncbi:MAG: hypothetical protein Q8926_06760 [Bacteroidota bacterium]|nr:hypothetical protein [Bacteroidota bacterium]